MSEKCLCLHNREKHRHLPGRVVTSCSICGSEICPAWKVYYPHHNEVQIPDTVEYGVPYYLSGPMTGYKYYNYDAFHQAAFDLRGVGLRILSPAENGLAPTRVKNPWEWYMKQALIQLANSKAVILLPGWPQSKGARIEVAKAFERELPMYYYSNAVLHSMNRDETNYGAQV